MKKTVFRCIFKDPEQQRFVRAARGKVNWISDTVGALPTDKEKSMEETRIALVGIIVEDFSATEKINLILHDCSEYIVGRMGIPYRKKNVSILSVIMDAPADMISALSGKLGMIDGVNVKTVYTKGK